MNREVAQDQILRDVLRLLRRQKWVIIGTMLLAVAASVAYSLLKTKEYEARAQIQFVEWTAENRLNGLLKARPHLKWADGLSHGYIVLDVTKDAVQADFFGVPTIDERTAKERFVKGFTSAAGAPHLVEASTAARANPAAPEPAL